MIAGCARLDGWGLGAGVLLFGWLAVAAPAQVFVRLSSQRNEFLLFEPIKIQVELVNQTGEVIDTGRMKTDGPWLEFMVTNMDHESISQGSVAYSPPRIALLSNQSKVLTVNLTPYFPIQKPGRYLVNATVSLMKKSISSNSLGFAMVRGSMIWSRLFKAPPAADDPSHTPRDRLYALFAHRQAKGQILYACVREPDEGRVFCMEALGNMIDYGDPQSRIDNQGTFHIFYQSGTRTFTYVRFSVNGKFLGVRYFANLSSQPSLVVLDNREMEVLGGEEIFIDEKTGETVVPTAPLVRPQ
ncbi:MAG: hypothetical protein PHV34_08050 [Verrucomicrobiae bacterium]|nr:hypothetical protein [Verrucomicrobiae bacterium]